MNILIIGLGSIAQKHLTAIRELIPEAKVFALRSSENADSVNEVTNIFTISALTVKPDFIIISNPTRQHEQAIEQSLQFGCPLFIEKPVLSDTINSLTLLNKINEAGILTYVACNLRFHPAILFLKKLLEESKTIINEVNVYCGSYLPEWRPGKNFRELYSSRADMGGGAHLDLIHELDYTCWLFGQPETSSSVKRNVSSLHIDAVDAASYHLLYNKFTANITLNYFRRDSKREIEIVTEQDTIKADLITNKVISYPENKILFNEPFDIKLTYRDQLRYFLNHISLQKQPMNSFKEAVDILKIALS